MSNTTATTDFEALFDSFDIEDLGVLEVTEGVALPEMGASSGNAVCCSSSSSSSSSCC
ncbi:thiazolylpeptide-type bacteriocin [Streptomyces sp. NPDC058299]|uniref:thiazolylpeptide-type bacteriocin n=1 Tax=unclassified Streptomyces TaxID=2593676 RepID=UPI0036E32142